MTHTPTPWRQEGYRFRDNKKQVMLSYGINSYRDGPEGYPGYLEMSEEDAAFVLDAVNAHADLIEALRNLVDEVTGFGGFGPEIKRLIGEGHWSALAQRVQEARAVISKAKELSNAR